MRNEANTRAGPTRDRLLALEHWAGTPGAAPPLSPQSPARPLAAANATHQRWVLGKACQKNKKESRSHPKRCPGATNTGRFVRLPLTIPSPGNDPGPG